MKFTKTKLKQMIKEELKEGWFGFGDSRGDEVFEELKREAEETVAGWIKAVGEFDPREWANRGRSPDEGIKKYFAEDLVPRFERNKEYMSDDQIKRLERMLYPGGNWYRQNIEQPAKDMSWGLEKHNVGVRKREEEEAEKEAEREKERERWEKIHQERRWESNPGSAPKHLRSKYEFKKRHGYFRDSETPDQWFHRRGGSIDENMKLTKSKLKQIIKEELDNVIQERGMTLMTHGNCEELYDQYITAKQGGYTEEQMSLKNQLDKAGCIKMDEGGLPGDLFKFDFDDETGKVTQRMSDKYQRRADREDAEEEEKRKREKRMADADARREPTAGEKQRSKDDSHWKRIFRRGG
tara:strand:+ start:340 stop:1395 length:1056 start_codon:yes stop_codon:yes gene_type:complete